jgi:hypothetical protein
MIPGWASMEGGFRGGILVV